MSDLLTLLRHETAAAHQALEEVSALKILISPALDLTTYGDILQKFYGFYEPLEAQRDGLRAVDFFPGEVRPLPLLRRDLHRLGLDPAQMSPAKTCIVIDDVSAYLGYLYVKQGSTLGGQIIADAIDKHLSLRPGREQHFFHGRGPRESGKNWKDFCAYLPAPSENVLTDKVVATANHCFVALQDGFMPILAL